MPRRATGVLADPNFRRERARMGGAARTSPDYYIAKLNDAAASLTDAHWAALRGLLNTAPTGRRGVA